MKELAAVSAFDPVAGTISMLLFIHLRMPIREVTLSLDEPDTMLKQLANQVTGSDSFSTRMKTHLVAMFHEARHSQATGHPDRPDVELLLALTEDSGDELTTLYQKLDRKISRLNRLLLNWLPEGKPHFVLLLFEKLFQHAPDSQLMDRYVTWCCRRRMTDKLLSRLDFPIHHPGCLEDTVMTLTGIALHHRKHDLALQLCEQVLEKNYGNVHALIAKAQCRYQQGDDDYLVYIQKAFHFNKRITVETISRRFEFRKDTRMDMFDVMSLKDAVTFAGIPPDVIKRLDILSLPFRTENIQGSVYFVREELVAWKKTMDALNIVSGRFGG